MYKLLKKEGIPFKYEGEKYVLIDGFRSESSSYEKTATKKYLHDRGHKKILPITYTPDFIDSEYPPRYVIECKGTQTKDFPLYGNYSSGISTSKGGIPACICLVIKKTVLRLLPVFVKKVSSLRTIDVFWSSMNGMKSSTRLLILYSPTGTPSSVS